ncbi:hypothetical protein QR680_003925 [Steinernema hermaphroditum]|uniref:Uncharacterized protein n=1 Tax=Steinernema hermaphroditum TaxID=289476 RepID=A0AA39HPB4_9BILA|nr:hypothetical protein QR680_003925 [Steinernema hermaphroditum]
MNPDKVPRRQPQPNSSHHKQKIEFMMNHKSKYVGGNMIPKGMLSTCDTDNAGIVLSRRTDENCTVQWQKRPISQVKGPYLWTVA